MTQEFENHVAHAIEKTSNTARTLTYPLFAFDQRGQPELYATCIFIELDGSAYLITAAHAYREITQTGSDLWVGTEIGIDGVEGTLIITPPNNRSDELDIAAIRVKKEFIEKHKVNLIPMNMTCAGSEPLKEPDYLCVCGYPISKNKQFKALMNTPMCFDAYSFAYAIRPKEPGQFEERNKNANIHIAFSYQKTGRDHKKEKRNPPNPTGLSGGGLWYIPDSFSPHNIYLAGILIEYHKEGRVGYATKIERVWRLIRKNFN